jgi:preprotein translocase subunit Sss1
MGTLVNRASTTVLATGVVTLIVGLNGFLIFLLITGR